jgi:hypothetical protein
MIEECLAGQITHLLRAGKCALRLADRRLRRCYSSPKDWFRST